VIYLAEEKKNIVSVTICFQIIIIYAQSVHSGLDVTSWLIETLTINWSNSTALIHGLDVGLFWAHHSSILLSAILA